MAEDKIKKIEAVFNYRESDEVLDYRSYWEKIKEVESKLIRYESGFLELDGYLEGFVHSELTVVSGPTGNGKTLFCDSLSYKLMKKNNLKTIFFSFEIGTKKYVEKYIQRNEDIGLCVPAELKPGNFEWLVEKCFEAKIKYGCSIVVIDHLHYLVDMSTKQNMSLNIGAVMRQLKTKIAIEMDMMVFIIAHQAQPKQDTEPSIQNIRDSSFIGQEADNVLIVYRTADKLFDEDGNVIENEFPSFDQGNANVKIEKSRRSGAFRKNIHFKKNGDLLDEML